MYCFVVAILIIIGYTLRYLYLNKESYYNVVRLYNLLEYTLLAYFFSLYITNKIIKKILLFSILAFSSFCFYEFLSVKTSGLPFITLSVEYITLLIFIIYYFFEVMQESVVEPIYQKPIFWISVAFIINFSGNFFLFLYSRNSYNDESFKNQYAIIYTTVTVIKNILLCISILIKEKQEPNLHPHPLDIDLDTIHPISNKTQQQ